MGNLLIVVTITVSKILNSLLYFFLACLSFIDLMYVYSISPRLISYLYFGENTISFQTCLSQLFTEHFFGGSQIILLLVMACNRYVVICKSLHYLVIMRQSVCVVLLLLSFVSGFVHSVI